MTAADLKLVDPPAGNLADPQLCDPITKFLENITTMANDAAQRVIPYLAATAAAG